MFPQSLKSKSLLQALRFIAVGALNTALDFTILNLISEAFQVKAGGHLGIINIYGFSAAVVQSYIWNRSWVFEHSSTQKPLSTKTEYLRIFSLGGLAALVFIAVFVCAALHVNPLVYAVLLGMLIAGEVLLWHLLGFAWQSNQKRTSREIAEFVAVSFVGVLINSIGLVIVNTYLNTAYRSANVNLLKNFAKIAATLLSLVWNFIGYRFIVFKGSRPVDEYALHESDISK